MCGRPRPASRRNEAESDLEPAAAGCPGGGHRRRLPLSADATATIRLLMLTGCRQNEILTVRQKYVDLDGADIRILDGKTGDRTVHLSPSAVGVLAVPSRDPEIPWAISGAKPSTHMTDIEGRGRASAR